eukprot:TRINITY_DN15167_c0_g1_i1.p1 TRINITY_DN15167_c0_g1~~TRINITY_DN15167_c0_g1_i1.p1  ORF type:complete len:215 (-),score=45.81 TRINITY_DN15167_c0_g1_i1:134-778(-)
MLLVRSLRILCPSIKKITTISITQSYSKNQTYNYIKKRKENNININRRRKELKLNEYKIITGNNLTQNRYYFNKSNTVSLISSNENEANDNISLNLYTDVLNETLDELNENLESLAKDIKDFDIELSDGVLTLDLGEKGTYVLNKQVPNKQLWFSSPISGPKRFFFDKNDFKWLNTRDNTCLLNLLNKEIVQLTKKDLQLEEIYENIKENLDSV